MLNSKKIAELRLSGNRLLKFHWHPRKGSLFVELQAPTTKRDGHGFGFVDGVTLQGAELQACAESLLHGVSIEVTPMAKNLRHRIEQLEQSVNSRGCPECSRGTGPVILDFRDGKEPAVPDVCPRCGREPIIIRLQWSEEESAAIREDARKRGAMEPVIIPGSPRN